MAGQEPDVGPPPVSLPTPALSATSDAGPPGAENDDRQRFEHLFTLSYQPLTAYARRRVADPADADDVVAETFAVAWRRLDQVQPDRSPLPWLYTIAANVIRNQRRSRGRRLRLVDKLEAQPSPGPQNDPAEAAHHEVRVALGTLSDGDQEVLRLAAWEGLPHAEIGFILDCSTNAVALRLSRARQRLQAALRLPDPAPTIQPALDPPEENQR